MSTAPQSGEELEFHLRIFFRSYDPSVLDSAPAKWAARVWKGERTPMQVLNEVYAAYPNALRNVVAQTLWRCDVDTPTAPLHTLVERELRRILGIVPATSSRRDSMSLSQGTATSAPASLSAAGGGLAFSPARGPPSPGANAATSPSHPTATSALPSFEAVMAHIAATYGLGFDLMPMHDAAARLHLIVRELALAYGRAATRAEWTQDATQEILTRIGPGAADLDERGLFAAASETFRAAATPQGALRAQLWRIVWESDVAQLRTVDDRIAAASRDAAVATRVYLEELSGASAGPATRGVRPQLEGSDDVPDTTGWGDDDGAVGMGGDAAAFADDFGDAVELLVDDTPSLEEPASRRVLNTPLSASGPLTPRSVAAARVAALERAATIAEAAERLSRRGTPVRAATPRPGAAPGVPSAPALESPSHRNQHYSHHSAGGLASPLDPGTAVGGTPNRHVSPNRWDVAGSNLMQSQHAMGGGLAFSPVASHGAASPQNMAARRARPAALQAPEPSPPASTAAVRRPQGPLTPHDTHADVDATPVAGNAFDIPSVASAPLIRHQQPQRHSPHHHAEVPYHEQALAVQAGAVAPTHHLNAATGDGNLEVSDIERVRDMVESSAAHVDAAARRLAEREAVLEERIAAAGDDDTAARESLMRLMQELDEREQALNAAQLECQRMAARLQAQHAEVEAKQQGLAVAMRNFDQIRMAEAERQELELHDTRERVEQLRAATVAFEDRAAAVEAREAAVAQREAAAAAYDADLQRREAEVQARAVQVADASIEMEKLVAANQMRHERLQQREQALWRRLLNNTGDGVGADGSAAKTPSGGLLRPVPFDSIAAPAGASALAGVATALASVRGHLQRIALATGELPEAEPIPSHLGIPTPRPRQSANLR